MALQRVRQVLRHPIGQNVVALYGLQFATFIVPLATLPYVARVLHPSSFGLIVFSQGVANVLVLFIDWGFSYTAVREAAAKRDDPAALAEIVQRVRGAQLLLSAASAGPAVVALLAVPKLASHPEFLVLAWVAAVSGGLAPNWYFLGIERVRLSSAIAVGFRMIGAALTFLLVKGPGDAWIVMALFAGSSVMTLLALDLRMYRRVALRRPRFRAASSAVKGATTIFVGTVGATLYTSFNVVLLGFFDPTASVAHFSAAEKVVRVSLQVLTPIGTAVYPRLAALQARREHERARQLLKLAGAAIAGVGLLLAGCLALFAPQIIRILYGGAFVQASVPILHVLVLIIPIGLCGLLGGAWLITLHMDRQVMIIVLRAGVLNVVLACVLTPLLGPIGMAWSVVSAEATAALGVLVGVVRIGRGSSVGLFARGDQPAAGTAPGLLDRP
ncbi:MAG: oligosaccharide flippase family protein [Solirubrobacteraceae bacterium]